jgi:hypothetical protein
MSYPLNDHHSNDAHGRWGRSAELLALAALLFVLQGGSNTLDKDDAGERQTRCRKIAAGG